MNQSSEFSLVKSKLYESFKSNGIETALKAQLRLQLIQLFKKHVGSSTLENLSRENSLVDAVLNSLIADHLLKFNYRYTLSVFLPECGLQAHSLLKPYEVLKFLNLDTQFLELTSNAGQGMLAQILSLLAEKKREYSTKEIQTDVEKESLDKKLKVLDDELLLRTESERLIPVRNFEERLIKIQRECEEQYRQELSDQVGTIFRC